MNGTQTIFHVNKRENYFVQIDKRPLSNPNLSLKAKGLLAYLLSLPNDWEIYESELISHSTDGRYSTRMAVKELIGAGHIFRKQKYDKKGRFAGWEYLVFEQPQAQYPPLSGFPISEKPLSENQHLLINNGTNNNKTVAGIDSFIKKMAREYPLIDAIKELEDCRLHYGDKEPSQLQFKRWLDRVWPSSASPGPATKKRSRNDRKPKASTAIEFPGACTTSKDVDRWRALQGKAPLDRFSIEAEA
ncbi:hypothetical protein ACFLRP_03585 [Bacteroidota bacterium]